MSVAKVPQPGQSRWVRFRRALIRDRWLYLIMILPCLYYLLFHYYPMYGVTLAFKQYKPKLGIIGSPWASQHGMKYILQVVQDPYFWTVFKNTIVLNVVNLAITFPAPIILALLLNEVASNRYKRVVQTVTYLPHFLSTVVVVGMMNTMFSSSGIVNELLGKIGLGPFAFLNDAQYFRPMYIGSNIWQNIGWDSIIFLAALSGLDQALYEAARIDGAGRWKQTIHITIPGILPTIVIMLILAMGKIMNVSYQKILLMMTGSNQSVSDVISTYVYRRGITKADFSYATAVGLFQSLVSLVFVTATNWISRRTTETSLW
ncbi:MAG: ABC transporter permease subunit [Eubacteriales bacterium]|nr:ABC transporter permease subunit [Eubacteriales bacterium]